MAGTVLSRLQLATYKPSGDVMIPTNATVAFYRPGATVTSATTITASSNHQPISVNDSATLSLGDTVTVGPGGDPLVIDGISSNILITVANGSGSSVVVGTGVRLILPYNRPAVFLQRGGDREALSEFETDSVTGRGTAYLAAGRYDYTVEPPGEDIATYPDAPGASFVSSIAWNDVRDYSGIQEALDALPETGGVVYVPSGIWDLYEGLVINKEQITLIGDGPGTVIRAHEEHLDEFDLITVNRSYFRALNLQLDARAEEVNIETGHCGIVMNGLGISEHLVQGCTLQNVQIHGASRYGLWLQDALTFLGLHLECTNNLGHGARVETVPGEEGQGSTTLRFIGCVFSQNGLKGFEANKFEPPILPNALANMTLFGCVFEGNKGGTADNEGNALDAEGCPSLEVIACHFADAATDSRAYQFIWLNTCRTAILEACWFDGGDEVEEEHFQPRRAVRFQGCQFSRLSNNSGTNLFSVFAEFSSDCDESVEMGNDDRDVGALGLPRITIEGDARVVGFSRGAVALETYADSPSRPDYADMREGSLIWVMNPDTGQSQMQVANSEGWNDIALT